MAHKLANGDYRHKDVRIIKRESPCSTGWSNKWEVRWVGNDLNRNEFDTLKLAADAIDCSKRIIPE